MQAGEDMEIIVTNGKITAEEQAYYERYILDKYHRLDIKTVYLTLEGETVCFEICPRKRILTKMGGSLIGDPLDWNDAKCAEYFDTIPNPL